MDLLRTVGWTLLGIGGAIGLVTLCLIPGKIIEIRRKRRAEHPPASDGKPFLENAEVDPCLYVEIKPASPSEPTPLAADAFDAVPWTSEGCLGADMKVWEPWGFEDSEFESTWPNTLEELGWDMSLAESMASTATANS